MLLAGTILLRLVARDTICNCWYRLFLVDWWGGVVVGFYNNNGNNSIAQGHKHSAKWNDVIKSEITTRL